MPSYSESSIFNRFFGCCLGWGRRSGTSSGLGDQTRQSRGGRGDAVNGGDDDDDERAPLLAKGSSNGPGNSGGGAQPEGNAQDTSDKTALYSKKGVDAGKLAAIRNQANDAFFHIDGSQLLPSSSSSRPINMSTSQMGLVLSSKRGGQLKDDAHHQALVAQSDKAERLYRAAMASPTKSNLPSDGSDPAVNGDLDDEREEEASEAPLSLVRQMKVSIREAPKKRRSRDKRKSISRNPTLSPQDALSARSHLGQRTPDEGEEYGDGDDGGREGNGKKSGMTGKKLHSMHSLRTLRLGAHSSMGSPSLRSEADGTDDEDWSRRGRTRSKRGLAWMDVGQSRDLQQQQPTNKLSEMFSDSKEGGESAQGIKDKATSKEGEGGAAEDVPNALRLPVKQSQVTRDVAARLKASSPLSGESLDASLDEDEANDTKPNNTNNTTIT